jgi:uncharacterized membrane protein
MNHPSNPILGLIVGALVAVMLLFFFFFCSVR